MRLSVAKRTHGGHSDGGSVGLKETRLRVQLAPAKLLDFHALHVDRGWCGGLRRGSLLGRWLHLPWVLVHRAGPWRGPISGDGPASNLHARHA